MQVENDLQDCNYATDFTTLGMFILDQIHYGPLHDHKIVDNIIGGGGTFAIIGARIFSPPPLSHRIGWIVDCGHDFPATTCAQLQGLNTHLILRDTPTRATTRGRNSYGPGELRSFRYLTPKKQLFSQDLINAGLARSKFLHLICSPERAAAVCKELRENTSTSPQRILWEPIPGLCTPEYRQSMLETTRIVDVVSPNDDELAGFFLDANRSEQNLEEQAKILVTSGVGVRGDGAVVVRAGKRGCYVASRESQWWLPAYYSPGDSSENHPAVIDPTGGGNAFMGGLGIGLVRNHGNLLLAAAWGIVAASFAIEQIGIPELNNNNSDIGEETWNGVKVMDRIESYKARLKTIGIDLDSAG